MTNQSDWSTIFFKGLKFGAEEDCHPLVPLLEQLVDLQEKLADGPRKRTEPESAAEYNELHSKINHLLEDPNFTDNIHLARNCNPWLAFMLYLVAWLLLWLGLMNMAEWTDRMSIPVLSWLFSWSGKLLNWVALVCFVIFVIGWNVDPGKFKSVLYVRNRELMDLVKTLYWYARDAVRLIPSSRGKRIEQEKRLEALDERMRAATDQTDDIQTEQPDIQSLVRSLSDSSSLTGASHQEHLVELRGILTDYFSEGELRTLCFDLNVDYESLPGDGKAEKARELIVYLDRRDRIPELVGTGKQLRPNAPWNSAADLVR